MSFRDRRRRQGMLSGCIYRLSGEGQRTTMLYCAELQKKWPQLVKKSHDNAPASTSGVALAKFVELRYELLPNPPCSPFIPVRHAFVSKFERVRRVKEVGESLCQVYRTKMRPF